MNMNININMNKLAYYFASTAAYGFYRGSTFDKPKDKETDVLFSDRLSSGIITSFLYVNPLMQPLFFCKLLDRIEIKLKNKDPSKYESAYCDFYNYNYKMI